MAGCTDCARVSRYMACDPELYRDEPRRCSAPRAEAVADTEAAYRDIFEHGASPELEKFMDKAEEQERRFFEATNEERVAMLAADPSLAHRVLCPSCGRPDDRQHPDALEIE